MGWSSSFLLVCLSWVFFVQSTHQLQSSQTQVVLQLRKHLEYPKQLEIWSNRSTDFCFLSSGQANMTCQNNFVTELRILGDRKPKRVTEFDGFSIPGQTLSETFSMDSFVATLARLTGLRVLVLESLGIWGPLHAKIQRLYSLEYLDLSGNYLFGFIPPQISRLVKIQTLVLDGNFLNGTFPGWFYSLPNLTYLSLRENHLSGLIPSSGHGSILLHLQHLDLSFNHLNGPPPSALFSLPNISYLNLASNMFTGSLPNHLTCGNQLQFVNISNNRIKGLLPSCLSNASDKRVINYGGNCLLTGVGNQQPESSCEEVHVKREESKAKGKGVGILVGVIGGIFAVVLVLAFGFLLICRRYCPSGSSEQHLLHKAVHDNSVMGLSSDILTSARYISQAANLGSEGIQGCRLFSLEELMEATNNFDKSCIMGESSYGKIHKGRLENGAQVAIRCLNVSKKYTVRNLKLRLELLAKLRHPHLVCLLGFCINGGGRDESNANEVYLIYEYVPNGNYRAHLSDNSQEKTLKWADRLSALIGVAKAVHFLHTGIIPGFFNNRLKANNICLNEHMMAKLSDYGLSIVIAEDEDHNEAKGHGLNSWQMKSLEDDVYSFGFILLESIVGPTVSARREAFLQNEMVSFGSQEGRRRIVDPLVLSSCSQESLMIVIDITNKCLSPDSSTRPSFEDVLWNLQYAAQIQANADGDQRS
ncbi:hypothetical protein RHSIM_Rhsim08G0188300 [Rhododendron simsii]|uniref:Protein kinase domain-containing protein n=1 Tax=Rhododendron simsii TaxID=118357 RepID=A0A834GJD2_RHOSS|nr:hypothetical protein RHSIM_Rhsim08G0188300 [Rhododendron simsii]